MIYMCIIMMMVTRPYNENDFFFYCYESIFFVLIFIIYIKLGNESEINCQFALSAKKRTIYAEKEVYFIIHE